MKRLIFVILLSFGIVQLGLSQGSGDYKVKNSLSNVTVITVEGGVTIGQTDYADIKPGYIGKGSLEYFFGSSSKSNFGIKAFGGYGTIGGTSSYLVPAELRTTYFMAGAALSFTIAASDVVYPYISLGVSHLWVTPKDNNGVEFLPGETMFKIWAYTGEAGIRFMLGQNVSLNVIGGLMTPIKSENSDALDGHIRGEHQDWVGTATVGLSFYLGRDTDTDGDGVNDSKDMCPNTPMGVTVDEFGCPVDSDNDGVADYLDKCANTPAGVTVDASGCPVDSDGDGVADYLDKCANTPVGVTVDASGCPIDTDNDGVADYLDKCPNTPSGVNVDDNGCPLDSDGDGVPNYLDKCPDTPKGNKVDANGCTIVKTEATTTDIYFAFDKSALQPKAIDKLNEIVESLKQSQDYSVSIEGYTDAIGTEAYNMKLSTRRAKAVSDYLISKGVNKNNLETTSFGETNPVATNKTDTGRAANRRVVIKIN
jgi:outer membrane protein OmpA-like peptidoglycan-associated protein/outer membrane protein W